MTTLDSYTCTTSANRTKPIQTEPNQYKPVRTNSPRQAAQRHTCIHGFNQLMRLGDSTMPNPSDAPNPRKRRGTVADTQSAPARSNKYRRSHITRGTKYQKPWHPTCRIQLHPKNHHPPKRRSVRIQKGLRSMIQTS
jgi:hypothetical protein